MYWFSVFFLDTAYFFASNLWSCLGKGFQFSYFLRWAKEQYIHNYTIAHPVHAMIGRHVSLPFLFVSTKPFMDEGDKEGPLPHHGSTHRSHLLNPLSCQYAVHCFFLGHIIEGFPFFVLAEVLGRLMFFASVCLALRKSLSLWIGHITDWFPYF